MSSDCIFCKIIHNEIPSFRIYEDGATVAFMDINPVHDGHVLVIPRKHAANVIEVSADAIASVARTARKVAAALQAELNPPGLNLLQCNGRAAAQSVNHFHMHVLPRKIDDGVSLNWPLVPGDMQAIETLAGRLRKRLGTAQS